MTTVVTRAQWGARAPRNVSNNITPANGGVAIHHVGTGSVARPDHSQCAAQVRGIQNFHMDEKTWSDIAYTYLVCAHDHIFVGRGKNVRTAANGSSSGNQNWYAVCGLVGDGDAIGEKLVDAYKSAIVDLRTSGGAGRGVTGHRDHVATTCPGEKLYEMVTEGTLTPGPGVAPPWPGIYQSYPPIMRGSSVTTWQKQMRVRGWSITADGAYGPASKSACTSFQRDNGLTADGIVGPATWDATWA